MLKTSNMLCGRVQHKLKQRVQTSLTESVSRKMQLSVKQHKWKTTQAKHNPTNSGRNGTWAALPYLKLGMLRELKCSMMLALTASAETLNEHDATVEVSAVHVLLQKSSALGELGCCQNAMVSLVSWSSSPSMTGEEDDWCC